VSEQEPSLDSVDEQFFEVTPVALLTCGEFWVAFPVHEIEEITEWRQPSPLPGVDAHISGVLNFRGRALPLLDLAALLNTRASPRGAFQRIVIVNAASMRVGIETERVSRIIDARPDEWHAVEAVQGDRLRAVCVAELRLKEGVVGVLDTALLLELARVR
jgi:purine-binding chemotaxis protein CheW